MEGYTVTGEPFENVSDVPPLTWDRVRGWVDECLPVLCGELVRPARSHAADFFAIAEGTRLHYGPTVNFMCDTGYRVDGYTAPVLVGPGSPPPVYAYERLENTYCLNDQTDNLGIFTGVGAEQCKALCDAHPQCTTFELSCGEDCILLDGCLVQERQTSACGSDMFVGTLLEPKFLIQVSCQADGTLGSDTGTVCAPICGDGRYSPTEHLPRYERREECDDGNPDDGDGCSSSCRVEPGYICQGGSLDGPDRCEPAQLYTDSTLWLEISGQRIPTVEEIQDASLVAISDAVGCQQRDVEIYSLQNSSARETSGDSLQSAAEPRPAAAAGASRGRYHPLRLTAEIKFKVKISDPVTLTINEVQGALETPGVLLPKLIVAYSVQTSLRDLYVRPLDISVPTVVGDRELGLVTGFSLRELLFNVFLYGSPIIFYLLMIGVVMPIAVWFLKIQPRGHRLAGRFNDVSPEFRDGWAHNLCAWLDHKSMCCALVCCLPARLADTWDAAGQTPYWKGVRKAMCCCLMYMTGLCICGATIPAAHRSDLRDFFGFGDKVKGNMELSDWCCYVCCPICCVVQEALHVDGALKILPPPFKERIILDQGEDLEAEARATRRPSMMSMSSIDM